MTADQALSALVGISGHNDSKCVRRKNSSHHSNKAKERVLKTMPILSIPPISPHLLSFHSIHDAKFLSNPLTHGCLGNI
jgi:hypothetical protein